MFSYKRIEIVIFFSVQFFLFLVFALNSHVPAITARNVAVNMYRNKVLIGYNYRNITSLDGKRCLEYCLGDCRCLSFQVCSSSYGQDCQLLNSSKILTNDFGVEDRTNCDHFEFNYQDMMNLQVLVSNIHMLRGCPLRTQFYCISKAQRS